MKQHKWHKEIKAWADGAEIEVLDTDGVYRVVNKPNWNPNVDFRIKPQPKEQKYLYVYSLDGDVYFLEAETGNADYLGKIKLEDDE